MSSQSSPFRPPPDRGGIPLYERETVPDRLANRPDPLDRKLLAAFPVSAEFIDAASVRVGCQLIDQRAFEPDDLNTVAAKIAGININPSMDTQAIAFALTNCRKRAT